jgi:hypothetical protein
MLKADAKRIAWFLSLGRILHFPRFFLAPPTIVRPGRGFVAFDPETASRGGTPPQSEHATLARPSGVRPPSLSTISAATSSIDRTSPTNILRVVRANACKPVSSFSPWRSISNFGPVAKQKQVSEKYNWHQSAVRLEFAIPRDRNRLIDGSREPRTVSQVTTPFAPIHVSTPDQRLAKFEPYRDPAPIDAGTGEINFERPPFLPHEQPALTQGSAGRYQSASMIGNGTAERNQPQRSRPTVATLHIDGAALGRWTVQHLERALGKPATGMTGVDPRATIPRSRVAPF